MASVLHQRALASKRRPQPGDAMAAADLGCDGIIVSNHGGRSLDTVHASIDALPDIAKRVGKRVPSFSMAASAAASTFSKPSPSVPLPL